MTLPNYLRNIPLIYRYNPSIKIMNKLKPILTNKAELEKFSNKTYDNYDDDQIQNLSLTALKIIELYLNLDYGYTTSSQVITLGGNGSNILYIPNFLLITEILGLDESGKTISRNTYLTGGEAPDSTDVGTIKYYLQYNQDYDSIPINAIYSNYKKGEVIADGFRNLKITGIIGYFDASNRDNIPEILKQVSAQILTDILSNTNTTEEQVRKYSADGYNIEKQLRIDLLEKLRPLREISI